jgi:hypothetical protein
VLIGYCALSLGALLLAIAQHANVYQLTALLLLLSGPAIGLLLFGRQSTGYIGLLDERLLLADHTGQYHFAGGSRIQYLGPFVAIDDVVVFTGNELLPAFSPAQIQQLVRPLAVGGIKVDVKTMLVKLLQSHHPLAQGLCVIAATTCTAIVLLVIPVLT